MDDKKFYKIVKLDQHPQNCGCYYAWIEIYKDYGGGPLKLKEEYYADLRCRIDGHYECYISPMDSMRTLWEEVDTPFTKRALRARIDRFFKKQLGYIKL